MINFDAVIAAESTRFADAIRHAQPDADVPTCPDWTVTDLAWHLTDVHALWARILSTGAVSDDEAGKVEASKPERPQTLPETLERFEAETAELLHQLSSRSDHEPAWFWLDTAKTVGSTRRMQAHEATMHRVDAELAAGLELTPIAADLAADGISHALEVMWAWWGTLPGFTFYPASDPVELRSTDAEPVLVQAGSWQGVGQSGKSHDVPTARIVEGATPAATVSGTIEQQMRWLWGRGDEPETFGDEHSLNALRAAQAQGMG